MSRREFLEDSPNPVLLYRENHLPANHSLGRLEAGSKSLVPAEFFSDTQPLDVFGICGASETTLDQTRQIFFVYREPMVAGMARRNDWQVVGKRGIKEGLGRDMVSGLLMATIAVDAILYQSTVGVVSSVGPLRSSIA